MDGKNRQRLRGGDYVRVTSSASPIPTVNLSGQSGDWFGSLSGILNWNKREVQKASSSPVKAAAAAANGKGQPVAAAVMAPVDTAHAQANL